MELAKIVESLSNLRDSLGEIGMKSLPDDYQFVTKAVPTYSFPPEVVAAFYLVMHNFRLTAEAFTHYGLNGFITDDENISKNPNYYLNMAAGSISRCKDQNVRLVL